MSCAYYLVFVGVRMRFCVFCAFVLVVLCFAGFIGAQSSVDNFRWLGDSGLALSGQPESSEQWEAVKSLGINATVNLRCEAQDNETFLDSVGIEYYYLPVSNSGSWNLTEEQVDDGVHWINSELAEGKKVLIHCQLGQNRAPTLAMMWYIHEGHTAEEAYGWVLQYPVSAPYNYQMQRAVEYYDWLFQPSTSASTVTPASAAEDFSTVLVVAVVVIVAIVGIGLLIYLEKRARMR
jgi:protein-tyrosine phosphatase